MSRNKFLLPLFLAAFGVCSYCHAASEVWYGSFLTSGSEPDKYSDGTAVRDGDYYAIVWRDASKPFAGFLQGDILTGIYNGVLHPADRTKLLADTTNSQLVFAKGMASNGHMKQITCTFQKSDFADYGTNGTFSIYLLDARRFGAPTYSYDADGSVATVTTNVVEGVGAVQGYVEAAGLAYVSAKNAVSVSGTVSGKSYLMSTIDHSIVPNPVITKIRIEGDIVVLTVKSTLSTVSYNAVASETMTNIKAQAGTRALAPVNGASSTDDEIEIRIPRDKDAVNQFFSITRNPLN